MKRPSRVTLVDIAREAGVSKATASRALRGHPAISDATQSQVRRCAQLLGYRVNPLVGEVMRRFRHGDYHALRGCIAYITGLPTPDYWRRHLTYVGFYEGAREQANRMGFELSDIWGLDPKLKASRLTQILRSRGIRGIVLGPWRPVISRNLLDWSQFSLVQVGMRAAEVPLVRVCNHHYKSMERILLEVERRGYRRVGLVLQPHYYLQIDRGWAAAYELDRLRPGHENWLPPFVMDEWSEQPFLRWYRKQRPDVIIALHTEVLGWLASIGISAPRDVGFVHLDRATEEGAWSGIDQQPALIGSIAVELLVNQMIANAQGLPAQGRHYLVEGLWVEGNTLHQP